MPPRPLSLHAFSNSRGQVPSVYTGNDDPRTPLLSSTYHKSEEGDPWRPRRPSWARRNRLAFLVLLGILAAGSVFAFASRERISDVVAALGNHTPSQSPEPPKDEMETTIDPVELARLEVEALLTRQSKTLEQASARYTLKTRRPPPPNYFEWFQFAHGRSCLIDEYDQIHRDFEPFYQMAKEDPRQFQKMVERGEAAVRQHFLSRLITCWLTRCFP